MTERRSSDRRPIEILFNKFVDGHPHLCRVSDLSRSGLTAEQLGGPERAPSSFAIELRLPGDDRVIWAWVRSIRRQGRREALEFVAMDAEDRRRLERFLRIHVTKSRAPGRTFRAAG